MEAKLYNGTHGTRRRLPKHNTILLLYYTTQKLKCLSDAYLETKYRGQSSHQDGETEIPNK